MLIMTVAAAKILAVKVGTSIERPACLVSPPALFRACYTWRLKWDFYQIWLEQSTLLRYCGKKKILQQQVFMSLQCQDAGLMQD
jgi:hypothetical protein